MSLDDRLCSATGSRAATSTHPGHHHHHQQQQEEGLMAEEGKGQAGVVNGEASGADVEGQGDVEGDGFPYGSRVGARVENHDGREGGRTVPGYESHNGTREGKQAEAGLRLKLAERVQRGVVSEMVTVAYGEAAPDSKVSHRPTQSQVLRSKGVLGDKKAGEKMSGGIHWYPEVEEANRLKRKEKMLAAVGPSPRHQHMYSSHVHMYTH
jgi:hypothetical protein